MLNSRATNFANKRENYVLAKKTLIYSRLQAWHIHFKSLLGNPPVIDNKEEEVPEVLIWVPINDLILNIINKAYTGHELPAQWKTSNIVPIPKAGDLTKTNSACNQCNIRKHNRQSAVTRR